jgi:hypothetical protein
MAFGAAPAPSSIPGASAEITFLGSRVACHVRSHPDLAIFGQSDERYLSFSKALRH